MQHVRFRIDLAPQCSIGPGKIELLETIQKSGSIRRAATLMHMSYRRAWLLVDSLNRSFNEPVTRASTGGAGGGGVTLTAFGSELVRRYRTAAERIDKVAQSEFSAFTEKIAAKSPSVNVAGRKRLSKPTRKS